MTICIYDILFSGNLLPESRPKKKNARLDFSPSLMQLHAAIGWLYTKKNRNLYNNRALGISRRTHAYSFFP